MRRHLAYLKYVLRHKWFVFIACWKTGAPMWRAAIHDWHKFLPSEWFPYAYTFYNADGTKRYEENEAFNQAWNLHQKRGKHHWQHWLLTYDRGETVALGMPSVFIAEMLADWWGAGRAITGKWDAVTWYEANKDKMIIEPCTRRILEHLMADTKHKFVTPADIANRIRIFGH